MPYLTTFSREVNGPVWGPTTNFGVVNGGNYNYQANATNSGTLNPLIFHPRVAASGWNRNNGAPAVKNEPLVKYRFPLSKLALLESVGTTYSTADYTSNKNNIKSDILKYFGLVLASDSNGLYRHWIYTNPAGGASTTGATTILTLDTVAGLNREADFFELLQAGILSGSLGRVGRADNITKALLDNDSSTTQQIIRIGANLIDQWDADDYPTTITFNSSDFYGIEDLPYINEVFVRANGSATRTAAMIANGVPATLPSYPPYNLYLYFELWNPHQSSSTGTSYPKGFQIVPLDATAPSVLTDPNDADYFRLLIGEGSSFWYWNGTTWSLSGSTHKFTALLNNGVISIPSTDTYREPNLISATSAPWPGGPSIAAYSLGPIPSFPPEGNLDVDWAGSTAGATAFASSKLSRVCVGLVFHAVFQIQFQDSQNQWHTYGTFEGIANAALAGVKAGTTANAFSDIGSITPKLDDGTVDTDSFVKSDPRTFRFGPGENFPGTSGTGFVASAGVSLTPDKNTVNSPIWGGNNAIPFIGQTGGNFTAATPYRVDMWSVNDPAVTPSGVAYTGSYASTTVAGKSAGVNAPYYLDNDKVQRVGDARYAYPTTSPYFSNVATARPRILNRRFTSVGDLGYAFRDMPWKTLDFFSPNSADAGLLDLFTMDDAPVVAGHVNPNTAPAPVLKALLSGAQLNPSGNTSLSASAASGIAGAIYASATNSPFLTRADIVPFLASSSAVTNQVPSGIKIEREGTVRALAEASNTRTWNFLIDVVAQSGRYPATAATLDNFMVTGERRYWLHVAIDRYTGQIVDRQIEVVGE